MKFGILRVLRNTIESSLAPPSVPGVTAEAVRKIFMLDGAEFVKSCYLHLLGREAQHEEIHGYLNHLENGKSKRRLLLAIARSKEGLSRNANRGKSIVDLTSKPIVRFTSQKYDSRQRERAPQIWMDLTTSLEWGGGVVGIIRAELELACGLKKNYPSLRFLMQLGEGFVEIPESELGFLLKSQNTADAYMNFFSKYPDSKHTAGSIQAIRYESSNYGVPLQDGDVVFSCGWMDSLKEIWFKRVRSAIDIRLAYLVYDTILINEETSHFYHPSGSYKFKSYLEWISNNCDFLLFGGETARADTIRVQKREGWRVPPGKALKFGTDIVRRISPEDALTHISELGVSKPFMMSVGSLEPRKNYETLYRAYLMALEQNPDLPQLVICGKLVHRSKDLFDRIQRDPRVRGKIVVCSPTDSQLAGLYQETLFTLLPSVYEGYSLTLPESLSYGKLCLASDTPPLHEIGAGVTDFVAPFDVRQWANRILHFASDDIDRRKHEKIILEKWHIAKWSETSKAVLDNLLGYIGLPNHIGVISQGTVRPKIWMDLTLTYLLWPHGLNGIIRSEMTLAYHLKRNAPDTGFFAYDNGRFFEIPDKFLIWLMDAPDLSTAYNDFRNFWDVHERQGSGHRSPFQTGNSALDVANREISLFPENSIIFFAGIDMDGTGKLGRSRDVMRLVHARSNCVVSQLIYDMTPIIVPQLHQHETCVGYAPFVEFVGRNFDHLVYGGETCKVDAAKYFNEHHIPPPLGDTLWFGSEIGLETIESLQQESEDKKNLAELGITSQFVLCVGTLEPRKNHEVLYKAFLELNKDESFTNDLQIVFAGRSGWNSEDFIETVRLDKRTQGKLLLLTPTDKQLVSLYRKCLFTLLPSLYEGWSLTLPESLNYRKFCLASDVAPIRECGQDFVEYLHPLDCIQWANRIKHFVSDNEALRAREIYISEKWAPTSWHDATIALIGHLHRAHSRKASKSSL